MRSKRTASLVTATLIALLLSGLGQTQEETDSGIRAQPLTKALAEFAEQTGMQLVYPSELTAGVHSNGASTEGTPDEILDQLLTSTDLEYEYVNDRTIAIAASVVIGVDDQRGDSDAKNLSPARILLAQNATIQARTKNRSNNEENGRRDSAQDAATATPIEEIVVIGTGTNIRGVENSTSPILQYDRDDIDLSGARTVEDFLRTVPQNLGSTTQEASNSNNPFSADTGEFTTIDLRGLGAGSTLTLLNGRRLAPSGGGAFVDISAIPLGAVERVDVLTDGASAIYGSDAVGGVVNIVTRNDYEGLEIGARYGTVTDGGLDEYQLNLAGGAGWKTGNTFLGVEYRDRSTLVARDRSFVDLDGPFMPNPQGSLVPEEDAISLIGSVAQNFGNRVTVNGKLLFTDKSTETNAFFFDFTQHAENQTWLATVSASYDVSDDITAELFVDYGEQERDRSNSFTDFQVVNTEEGVLFTVDALVSGRLVELPAGKASFAIGGQFRREEFTPGSLTLFPGGAPKRDVSAVYAEVLVPLVATDSKIPFVDQLQLSIAGRYEDYLDFGDTFNPKIGILWGLNEDFAFRATYSEAFRAPTLQSIFRSEAAGVVLLAPGDFTYATPPADNPDLLFPGFFVGINLSGGNPGLKEETAEIVTAGLTYEPAALAGLRLSATFYDISYDNRIENVSTFDIPRIPAFAPLLTLNPDAAEVQRILNLQDDPSTFFTDTVSNRFLPREVAVADIGAIVRGGEQNLSSRDVTGMDVTAGYAFGSFLAEINVAHIFDYDFTFGGSDVIDELNTLYRPIDLKLRGTFGWEIDGFSAATIVNYVDRYADNIDASSANSIDSYTTVDLALGLDLGRRGTSSNPQGTRFGLNVINLFDEEPPFVETIDGLNYDPTNASAQGRYITLSVRQQF